VYDGIQYDPIQGQGLEPESQKSLQF